MELIRNHNKGTGYRANMKKSIAFLNTSDLKLYPKLAESPQ